MANLTAYVYTVRAMLDVTKCEFNEVVKTGEKREKHWEMAVVAKDKYLADAFVKKQADYYQNFAILSDREMAITAIIPIDYGLGPTLR